MTSRKTIERVFEDEQKVTVKESTLIQGVNAHSGKTYCRIVPIMATHYTRRSGKLRVLVQTYSQPYGGNRRTRGGIVDNTVSIDQLRSGLPNNRELNDSFINTFQKTVGELVASDYPLVKDIYPVAGIISSLGEPNAALALRKLMGRHYQKSLVKCLNTLATRYHRGLYMGHLLTWRGLVPSDWLSSLDVALGMPLCQTTRQRQDIRRLLTQLPLQTKKNLLKEYHDYEGWYLRDAAYIVLENSLDVRNLRARGLTELHDIVSEMYDQMNHVPVDIRPHERVEALVKESNDTLWCPRTTDDLRLWGRELGNCMGSYGPRMVAGGTAVLAVVRDGRPIGGLEIDPVNGDIRQCLGKYNRHLPDTVQNPIKKLVAQAYPGANVEGGWW